MTISAVTPLNLAEMADGSRPEFSIEEQYARSLREVNSSIKSYFDEFNSNMNLMMEMLRGMINDIRLSSPSENGSEFSIMNLQPDSTNGDIASCDEGCEIEVQQVEEENDGSVFGKIVVQNDARKLFAEMSESVLEEDLLGIEGTKDAHHLSDEISESLLADCNNTQGSEDVKSHVNLICNVQQLKILDLWGEHETESTDVEVDSTEKDVLGVRLTNFPSLSKLEFNLQVFDPGTDVLSRQDYERQLYANEGQLNANEGQMNLTSSVPPFWVQEVASSHGNDANLNHDLNYYLGTEDEIDAMSKSHYVPPYVEQADGIFGNDYLVFPFVSISIYSGCFNFMAEDNAILCPPELNSIMYLEVAYVSIKVSSSLGVYVIQIDLGLEVGVDDEERWNIGPLASWRHEEQRALKHSTTIDYSVDAVKLAQIAVTEKMEISEKGMKEKWLYVCVNVINQGQNDKIWGFNSTTEDEGAQIWCYWGYLQHFRGGCLIKLSTKLMMVSLMIVFSSNSHYGMRIWHEKMLGSAIFADDCFVIVVVKNLIRDLCHGKAINLGLGEQLTEKFRTWMLYALYLSSNGCVTIAKLQSFVWDPGQNVVFLYILGDKDVFERVGKDVVLMDTTLEMTGIIMILGCFSGQPFWNPVLDALYASRCISDGLRDTVGALDDIGLIPNALVFFTAELEHYIWDPGSFVSFSQLSWEDFGGDFFSHHLEDKVVVEGKDMS